MRWENFQDQRRTRIGWCGWWLRTSFDHPQTQEETPKEEQILGGFSVVTDLRNELGVETHRIHSVGVTLVRDGHPFQLVPISQESSHGWILKEKTTNESISFVVTLE